ncbi:MAG: tRNA (N(6)-L-threonylcarbamoyladenosine(37)-C(2))-methylthiotransferase MtaB [Acidobacteriota bacterium]
MRIDSVGCRLNIGEAEQLARALAARGHRVVGPGDAADLMVFNTCAVTHVAARKSRKLIRHWRRNNPGAALVVTGCYAQLSPAEVAVLGVDLVVSNRDKDDLPDLLQEAGLLRADQEPPEPDAVPLQPDAGDGRRTRAFIKVQDGCDNKCTFCIVTVARGDSRSRTTAEIVAEIGALVDAGYREAVLSGVHLGSYGHDRGEPDGLMALVRAVLRDTEVPRLRLSSLEPWDLGDDFFSLFQEDGRLQPHIHLPLQSGCDATLQRMARRTDRKSFHRLVEDARRRVPEMSVTTDMIVGFPGETDAEFEASIGFVEEMEFARLHVFRYSPREGTAAAGMPGQVDPATAQERSNRMHELGAELEARFRERFVGRTGEVLWESAEPRPEGLQWSGLTGNYLRVVSDPVLAVDLGNRVTETRLCGVVTGAMLGEPLLTAARERRAG